MSKSGIVIEEHCLQVRGHRWCIGARPPSHFANKTFVSATDVIDDVSRATLRICSIGTLLTRRIERTARRVAMATPGKNQKVRDRRIRRSRNDSNIGRSLA